MVPIREIFELIVYDTFLSTLAYLCKFQGGRDLWGGGWGDVERDRKVG